MNAPDYGSVTRLAKADATKPSSHKGNPNHDPVTGEFTSDGGERPVTISVKSSSGIESFGQARQWWKDNLGGRVERGERKDKTKTATERLVRLNSRALEAIRRQKEHTYLAGAEVFQDPRYGVAWDDERAFRRTFWTPLLKKLGILYRRPYNMRHSYATAMLMAGMTPAFCAKQLGHSVEMFLRTYAKWLDGAQNDLEMARLEASMNSPPILPRSMA